MQTLTGWKRKIILLFKSEKRLGAKQISHHFAQKDFSHMKAHTLTANSELTAEVSQNLIQDNPANLQEIDYEPKRVRDLVNHLTRLQQEFIGSSELCFYHTILVVLLRRGYKTTETFEKFQYLWQSEQDYLLKHLSLRWLVSAADTFVDFSPNPARQAIFLNVATLINTLKVYETKLDLLGNPQNLIDEKIHALQQRHLALYDGLHYFRLGTDDTLINMRLRYAKFAQVDKFASDFLLAVFDRLQNTDTAFSLMRQLHTDSKSAWWQDD